MRPFLTLHHPTSGELYRKQGLWRDETFYGLVRRHTAAMPDNIALEDGTTRLTWRELQSLVDGVALELSTYGLVGGDRVSIWMSNRVEAVVSFLACSRHGFACNPSLHQTQTATEIVNYLEKLSTKALFMDSSWSVEARGAKLDATLAAIPSLRAVFTPDTFPRPAPNRMAPCEDPDKVAYIAFTSGTTGSPKCVMHSDNTLLANARDLLRDWGHGPDTVILSLSPLSHHIAWVAVAQWLLAGCRFVVDDPPAGMSSLDWIEASGATYVLGTPTHAVDLLAEQKARNSPRLAAVRTFYMAGSAIPPSVVAELFAQDIQPQNVYGMTENSSHHYTRPNDDIETCLSSCGRAGLGYEVSIFDPDDPDRPLPFGEVGQIGGRGASLMLGYLGDQSATEASFNRDGWFMSGDLGALDEDGNLRIAGRIKEIIIRGGHHIYPSQIEAIAVRNVQVERAACFPVADERLGERVCIAIIGSLGISDLVDFLYAEGLSRHDMPDYFLRVPGFPLSNSGKILKRDLVAMVKRHELIPEAIPFRVSERLRA